MSVGQFEGGRLLKSTEAFKCSQNGRKSFKECKGRREFNCDTNKWEQIGN